jgi:hypothetical protein
VHQNPEHFALLSYLGTLVGNGVVPGLQDKPDAHGVHLDPVLATILEGLAVVQFGGQILPQVCLPEVGVRLGGDGVLGLEGQVIPQVLSPSGHSVDSGSKKRSCSARNLPDAGSHSRPRDLPVHGISGPQVRNVLLSVPQLAVAQPVVEEVNDLVDQQEVPVDAVQDEILLQPLLKDGPC